MPEFAQTFAHWQPLYSDCAISLFPVNANKRPSICGWNKLGRRGSAELVKKFAEAPAFGFSTAKRFTVLDVDSSDPSIITDALKRHGESPFVVRTGGGGVHVYYRYRGEPRSIRPNSDLPIDILGNGYVVAAPSICLKGRYQIISGGLSDCRRSATCGSTVDHQ
jgi:hypothetical protein